MIKSVIRIALCYFLIFGQAILHAQTTAAILPQGKTQFNNNNGTPLTSGTVDFYVPSTTTRKTTWQNSTKTIANANPVVLDAGGRAIIYGDGTYRQVVKDRNGNLIYDAVTASAGTGGGTTGTGDGDLVGTIKPWAGLVAPNQYAFSYGQEISRTTYSVLFTAITLQQSINCTSASPIATGFSDTSQIPAGAVIESTCFASGTSVLSKTSTTVTFSNNSSLTTTNTARIFLYGNGDGSTTFNVPDLRGYIIAGRPNMGGTASTNLTATYFGGIAGNTPQATGAKGGSQSSTLLGPNLPPYTPAGIVVAAGTVQPSGTGGGSAYTPTGTVSTPTITVANGTLQVTADGAVLNLTASGALGQAKTITATSSTPTFTGTPQNFSFANSGSTFTGTAQGGTSTAFSNVPSTQTLNYIIKITPDTNSADASGVTSLGGMVGDIACGTGLLCTGNIISSSIFTTLPVTVPLGGTGNTSFTANLPLIGNGTGAIAQGTRSGTTTIFATSSGALTNGNCLTTSSGNIVDLGSTCGGNSATPVYQIFLAPGAITTLTLTTLPVPTNAGLVNVTFDGITQARNTWSLNLFTNVITFSAAIPATVAVVEIDWWAPTTLAGVGSLTVGSTTLTGAIILAAGSSAVNLSASGQTISIDAGGTYWDVKGLTANVSPAPNQFVSYTINAKSISLYNPNTGARKGFGPGQVTADLTNNITIIGAGGRDTVTAFIVQDQAYIYYIAKNDGTLNTLSSKTCSFCSNGVTTGPVLPTGYTSYLPLFPVVISSHANFVYDSRQNDENTRCSFTGGIVGTVLTVTALSADCTGPPAHPILIGNTIRGIGVTGPPAAIDTLVTSLGTGTGGLGTYNLNQASAIAPGTALVSTTSYPASLEVSDNKAWFTSSLLVDLTGNFITGVTLSWNYAPYIPSQAKEFNVLFDFEIAATGAQTTSGLFINWQPPLISNSGNDLVLSTYAYGAGLVFPYNPIADVLVKADPGTGGFFLYMTYINVGGAANTPTVVNFVRNYKF